MLAQTYKINTSNALNDSIFAQFEQLHSCALLQNSKQLCKLEMLKTQIEWFNLECYWKKTRTFIILVAIGLGLGACSNVALKDQTAVNSDSLSQTNEALNTG